MRLEKAMFGHNARARASFDVQKAIAATAYLVEHTGESMYRIMKMMYLADKLHLERYGRFIAGDSYSALPEGPVPSATYDLMKHVRGEPQVLEGADLACAVFEYGPEHSLRLKCAPDYGDLSLSDIECLDEIVCTFKRVGSRAIREQAHDDAWRKTWGALQFGRSRPMSIESIAAELDRSDVLLKHLEDPQPGTA